MRIWINDTQLDTYEGSVSVSKTNNLWKFGKAEFVHTQTVKIPATNNSKALLDFADEFRTQSAVARGFVDCLVDIDGVFEQGRLYVSGYSDGEFSVIMTFGRELQSIDVKLSEAIKDSVIPDHLRIGETTDFMGTNLYDADGNVVKKVRTSLISKVEFADATYYRVDTLLASVVDSVQGRALYKASIIDIEAYNAPMTANSSVTDVVVAEYVSVGSVERTATEDKDYPLIDYYFMDFQGKQVLMEDRKLYRMVPKEKRRLYKNTISAPDFSWTSPKSLCKLMEVVFSSSSQD